MVRSFTDHIFGGACGGLAYALRVNVWLVRAIVVGLSIVSSGTVALLYLVLWWILPRESPLEPQPRPAPLPALILLIIALALAGAVWFGREQPLLQGPTGQDLLPAILLLIASSVFLLRQLRG